MALDDAPRSLEDYIEYFDLYNANMLQLGITISNLERNLVGLRQSYAELLQAAAKYDGPVVLKAGYYTLKYSCAFRVDFAYLISKMADGSKTFEANGFKMQIPTQMNFPKRIYMNVAELLDKFVWHRRIENKDGDHAIGRRVVSFTI